MQMIRTFVLCTLLLLVKQYATGQDEEVIFPGRAYLARPARHVRSGRASEPGQVTAPVKAALSEAPLLGLPAITNYRQADYHASPAIFGARQDWRGMMYFANNDGLLSFDGTYWRHFNLPNKAAVKSIAIDSSGRIYAGGQDEIGYFYPNRQGILTFHSIKQFIPHSERQFADILSIVILHDAVFFRTVETIFCFQHNKITAYDAAAGWKLLSLAGNKVYAVDKIQGLLTFSDGKWISPCSNQQTAGLDINGVVTLDEHDLLLTTARKGLFKLNDTRISPVGGACGTLFKNELITCAEKINPDKVAIGTLGHGLIVLRPAGMITERFSGTDGLSSARIQGVLQDRDQNLWISFENGVSFVHTRTAVKRIFPLQENQRVVNTAIVSGHQFFIGTSDGLFSTPLDNTRMDISTARGKFSAVAGTGGQVWGLSEIRQQLLAAHEYGVYSIRGDKARPLSPNQGIWTIIPLTKSKDTLLAGSYTGLEVLVREKNTTRDLGKVSGIFESLANLATDRQGAVWASHPYRGVFRLILAADKKTVTGKTHFSIHEGLPSAVNNTIYVFRDQVIAATEKGIYAYNERSGRFAPSAFFYPIFGQDGIYYLRTDQTGNIWFVSNKGLGVVYFRQTAGQPAWSITYFPELSGQTVRGAEFIYPYNKENVFVSSAQGMYHLNYAHYVQDDRQPEVFLGAVTTTAERDSLLFGGYFSRQKGESEKNMYIPRLQNRWKSYHFEYSSTVFAEKNRTEFSYQLAGSEQTWSRWSPKTEKDYTNLPFGTYTFLIRARNNLGKISPTASYTFIINPAWYESSPARLLGISLVCLGIYLTFLWQRRRFRHQQREHAEEQQRLNYLHNLELEKTEKEFISLQKESLQDELEFKNRELATLTMHMLERGGIILNIKQALTGIVSKSEFTDAAHEFRAVFRILEDTEKNDDDWTNFAVYFDKVHNNFLSRLKTCYPALSSTDLKLCAYLRLNLSSKEIAQLLSISPKGVEISRYRLRKKMKLTKEVNLYDFLLNLNH